MQSDNNNASAEITNTNEQQHTESGPRYKININSIFDPPVILCALGLFVPLFGSMIMSMEDNWEGNFDGWSPFVNLAYVSFAIAPILMLLIACHFFCTSKTVEPPDRDSGSSLEEGLLESSTETAETSSTSEQESGLKTFRLPNLWKNVLGTLSLGTFIAFLVGVYRINYNNGDWDPNCRVDYVDPWTKERTFTDLMCNASGILILAASNYPYSISNCGTGACDPGVGGGQPYWTSSDCLFTRTEDNTSSCNFRFELMASY